MRVALDATPLTVWPGGVARYTLELSRALAEHFPEDDVLLVSDQEFHLPDGLPRNLHKARRPGTMFTRRWWSFGLPRELWRSKVEVFHGTDFAVPYVAVCPSVLSLHDLSPWGDPGWHHAAGRVRRRTPFLIQLGLATMIVTLSEAVRRQAIDRFGIHPKRIAVVPPAASAQFRPVDCPAPAVPYFLYVGTLEPRKNLEVAIAAWQEVRKQIPVDLLLAGRKRADFSPAADLTGVRMLGPVADEDLPALYSGALAVLYPSAYEGFGLPVLEAMQCGAPVFTTRDPAIMEVAGDAAVRLDRYDGRAWRTALLAAARNPHWLAPFRTRGIERARAFSWQRTAQRMHEVYEEARRRFDG